VFSGAGIRTIASVRAANDGLRFLLELGLLVAAANWGWTEGHGWTSWLLVVLAPLAVAAAWGRFLAPKSDARVSDPWRLVVELLLFGAGTAALVRSDQPLWAAVFGGLVALHVALTFVLDQRRT
jgi:hypothetical protein